VSAPATKTRFDNLYGLAELPWFTLREGRLALADRSLGPIADVHTHLALGFLGRPRVDLEREHEATCHYLPASRPLDLDIYANQNMTTEDLEELERDLVLRGFGSTGMRVTHTAPNLVRDLADTGIARGVLLPIDYPLVSRNAETWLSIVERRSDLISLGSVHPFDPTPRARLLRQRARGARGIKIHPNVQLVAPDHPRAMRLYALCGELGMTVFFHAGPVGIDRPGGRRRTQMARYERPIAENPGTRFVLGHSGALQVGMGIELARRYPNCWLETSSQSLGGVRRILDEAPIERVMHGSDWPFYHPAISVAKVLIATEGAPEARRAVLWDNAARLFGLLAPAAR
jgi:predicted TIM-barrel fold metal-dependent hydrolase